MRWNRRALIAAGATTALLFSAGSAAVASGGATTTGADLQVTGAASTGSPNPGSPYSYTFQIKNNGPDSASAVVFSDPLPAGTVYNFATANGSTLPCAAFGNPAGGATVSCNVGGLAKGGQATVVVGLNAPQAITSYADTGAASASSTDPNAANNSATVTVQTKASIKNGVNDVAPTAPTPCATLNGLAAPTGYYLTWAAIWNTFTVKSCSTSTESVNVEVTETNTATGTIDYDVVMPMSLLSAQNISMVLDNDFAPFNTAYTVAFTVTDASANVLASGSIAATTPPPQ